MCMAFWILFVWLEVYIRDSQSNIQLFDAVHLRTRHVYSGSEKPRKTIIGRSITSESAYQGGVCSVSLGLMIIM